MYIHTAIFKMDNQQGSIVQQMELYSTLWAGQMGGEFMYPFTVDLKLPQHCEPVRCCAVLSHSVVSNSLRPHGLQFTRLLCPRGFSRQEIPMHRSPGFIHGDSVHEDHAVLQGTFPTQGSNPGLLHGRGILYQLSHHGSPRILEWVAYPFSRGSFQP